MSSLWPRLARSLLTVWWGAGLAISFIAIPVVFSPQIKALLPAEQAGRIAQSILGRYFLVQTGWLALSLAVRWLAGGPWCRIERIAWGVVTLGSLLAAGWLHPTLLDLQRQKYDLTVPVEVRESAAAAFRRWHGGSQAGNLLLLIALGTLAFRTGDGSASPSGSAGGRRAGSAV